VPSAPTQITPVDFNGSVTIFAAILFGFLKRLSLVLTMTQNDSPQNSEGVTELEMLMMECGSVPKKVSRIDQLAFKNSSYIPAAGA